MKKLVGLEICLLWQKQIALEPLFTLSSPRIGPVGLFTSSQENSANEYPSGNKISKVAQFVLTALEA